jgi:hypothetical protein
VQLDRVRRSMLNHALSTSYGSVVDVGAEEPDEQQQHDEEQDHREAPEATADLAVAHPALEEGRLRALFAV